MRNASESSLNLCMQNDNRIRYKSQNLELSSSCKRVFQDIIAYYDV